MEDSERNEYTTADPKAGVKEPSNKQIPKWISTCLQKAKNCLAYLKEQKERFEDDYEKKYSHILASIPNLASDGQSGKDHISKVVADQTSKLDCYKKELEALVTKLETHTTNHKSAPPSNETAFGINNSTICQGTSRQVPGK